MPMTYQVCFTAAGNHNVTLTASSVSLLTDSSDFFTVSLTVYGTGTTVGTGSTVKATTPPAPGMSPGT
jgi:hypothetical protein